MYYLDQIDPEAKELSAVDHDALEILAAFGL